MNIAEINGHKVLTPSEGYWLTNGDVFATIVEQPLTASVEQWREITEAEKMTLEAELEQQQESEATNEGE